MAELKLPGGRNRGTKPKYQEINDPEFYHQPNDGKAVKVIREIKVGSRTWNWIMAGVPLNQNGSIAYIPLLRNITAQLALCFLFYVAVAVSAGYIAQTGGTTHFLNGILYGVVVAMLVICFKQFRTTRNLPVNLSFAYTTAEMPHFRQGPIIWLIFGAVQLIAAILAWPTIGALVIAPVSPNWAAGPAGAFSTAGAMVYQLVVSFAISLAFVHNFTLDIHSYSYKRESSNLLNFTRVSLIGGLITGVAAAFGYMTGQFDFCNPFLYVAMILSTGGGVVPISGAWAVHLFVPLVGAVLGWAVHLWTWNQNGIDAQIFEDAAKRNLAAQKGYLDDSETVMNDKFNRL